MTERLSRVLIVDDNEMNRDMLSRRLARLNCDVEVAENGARALEMMQDSDFDLVLLDIMMPVMNGYAVLERAKSDPYLQHVPIIMISAVDDLDSVVRCIELGAEDYLFKPFNPVLLKARITASLDKKRLRDHRSANDAESVYASLTDLLPELEALVDGQAGPLNDTQHAQLSRIHGTVRDLLARLNRGAGR